jgi:cardiolipin synthase A/B
VLHAKGVIADDRRAFITSANLTAAALDKNIELGLLVTGGDVPRDLGLQIRELIRSGTLSRLS